MKQFVVTTFYTIIDDTGFNKVFKGQNFKEEIEREKQNALTKMNAFMSNNPRK